MSRICKKEHGIFLARKYGAADRETLEGLVDNSNTLIFAMQASDMSNANLSCDSSPGQYALKVLRNINEQRLKNQFTDVSLVINDTIIRAHRSILAASCKYFHVMFTGSLVEKQQDSIELQDFSPEILSLVIDFIYTGNLNITKDNVQDLFVTADFLQLNEALQTCSNYLKQNIDYSNAIGVYYVADRHNRRDLKEFALHFIEVNFPKVSQEDEFLELPVENVVQFLSSEYIHIETEYEVFQAAYNWLLRDIATRGKYAFQVFQHIRFRLCSSSRIKGVIEECNATDVNYVLSSVHTDIKENKGCVVPFHVQPRLCAKKNILVIGGSKREHSRDTLARHSESTYNTIIKYDTFTGTWSEIAPISTARILPGVALLDGKVYVVGGELESCIIANGECYDPRENLWKEIACMVEPRCDFGLCALDNNLYAFGGWVGEDIGGSMEIYDPVAKSWTLHGEMPEPRFSFGAVAYDGLIYIVGGCTRFSRHRDDLLSYNPCTRQWKCLAPLLTPRSQIGIAVLDGYMYVVGGTNKTNEVLDSVERYSFKDNNWSYVAPLNTGRSCPAVAAADGRLYVIGGNQFREVNFYRTQVTISTVECYDPVHDKKWKECASLPASRGEAAAVITPF